MLASSNKMEYLCFNKTIKHMKNVAISKMVKFTAFDNVYAGVVTEIHGNIAQVRIWGHFLTISVPVEKLNTDISDVYLSDEVKLIAWTKLDWLTSSSIRYSLPAITHDDDVLLYINCLGTLTVATEDYTQDNNPTIKELVSFVELFESGIE
jgi:hypothetical protein